MSSKGIPQTKEHRLKISKALIGHSMYKSKERSEKLRIANLGKKHSEETKKKMSFSHLGKKMPEGFGKMMSERQSGEKSYFYGKKQSPELIKKRMDARKGYRHSEETKRKMSISQRKTIHKTDESKIWRRRVEYRLWRESVFARDNWTCQKCLIRGSELHPHHIQNFAEKTELRFAIDNGITFCVKCHRKFHKIFGKKNNSLEQVNNFINTI